MITVVVEKHVETPVELTPLVVQSESDLLEKLTVVSCGLQSHNWEARREALKKLQELAVGGAARWGCFISHVKEMKEFVAQAVMDLRSLLAREACTTVSVLAHVREENPLSSQPCQEAICLIWKSARTMKRMDGTSWEYLIGFCLLECLYGLTWTGSQG